METTNNPFCVLLIDTDHPLLTRFLNEAEQFSQDKRLPQLRVTRCQTLHSALHHLPLHHYDLVILNSDLPDSQGEATLHHWRQLAPTIPLVFIVPQAETQLVEKAQAVGVLDVLYQDELSLPLLAQVIRQARPHLQVQPPINFERLAEYSSDIILLFDMNLGQVTYYNRPLIFGYASRELTTPEQIRQILYPEDQNTLNCIWRESLVSSHPKDEQPWICRIVGKEGNLYWIEGRCWVLQNDASRAELIMVAVRDITAQKQTELALSHQAIQLQKLLEISKTLRAAATIRDMASFIVAQAQSFDAAFSTLFLVEASTGDVVLIGHYPFIDTSQTMRLKPGEGIVGHVIQTGETYMTHDLAHDPYAWIAPPFDTIFLTLKTLVSQPLYFASQLVGVYTVGFQDYHALEVEEMNLLQAVAETVGSALHRIQIMEGWEQALKKRTAELAAANERLRSLDQLKNKFIHDVSHELRTPISNLHLYTDLLERGSPQKREHYQSVIRKQSQRLTQMLDDILSLSRLELGKERVQFTPVNLNKIVADITTAYLVQAESGNLKLISTLEPDLPTLLAEPNQLSQVVGHLLLNALKYTRQGQIQIVTSRAENEAEICLSVKDTGMGIAAGDIPHIFERFYRGHQASESAIAGTGLGLAIVWEIVQLHRGRIMVTSQPGQGSTFQVWLPLSQ